VVQLVAYGEVFRLVKVAHKFSGVRESGREMGKPVTEQRVQCIAVEPAAGEGEGGKAEGAAPVSVDGVGDSPSAGEEVVEVIGAVGLAIEEGDGLEGDEGDVGGLCDRHDVRGGCRAGEPLNSSEVFNPGTGMWTRSGSYTTTIDDTPGIQVVSIAA
jgi:hypothetical protein